MIVAENHLFLLETEHTAYAMRRTEQGLVEHLYYGPRLPRAADYTACAAVYRRVPDNSAELPEKISLEDFSQEAAGFGWGDVGEPLTEFSTGDGSRALLFRFAWFEKPEAPVAPAGLPAVCGKQETLKIALKAENADIYLELYYVLFPDCDVLVRWSRLINDSGEVLTVHRLLSQQLTLPMGDYRLVTFRGAWAREVAKHDVPLTGKLCWDSAVGVSSNRCNPFAMVCESGTGEEHGRAWGFNLIYSGNHYGCAQVLPYGSVRVSQGLRPFDWQLPSGESFDSPQAVLTFSDTGFAGVSRAMHTFVRRHIIRPAWQDRERPVLVNSWESFYFDVNHKKIVGLGKAARELGAELLVLDDGWFAGRKNDTCSLGDWTEDRRKFPKGLAGLAADLRKLGLDFGLWVEAEAVSEQSQLHKEHPDWILGHHQQAIGRHQYVLDLSRSEVCDYIFDAVAHLLSTVDIRYIKWDMNRIITDPWSPALPAAREGEVMHRYYLGLYDVLQRLTEAFPEVLFESCSSGGNRADLGMLVYMPQVWASDNTDAHCRMDIQTGYSYGYPQSVLGCHVSACPNHQTRRTTPLRTRFAAAAAGLLGYELDVGALSAAEKDEVKQQIAFYKEHRRTFQFGTYHRVMTEGNHRFHMVVSQDGSEAVGICYTAENEPNAPQLRLRAAGLEGGRVYHLTCEPLPRAAAEPDTPMHFFRRAADAAETLAEKLRKPEGDRKELTASGAALMEMGFAPAPAASGTGCGDHDSWICLFRAE